MEVTNGRQGGRVVLALLVTLAWLLLWAAAPALVSAQDVPPLELDGPLPIATETPTPTPEPGGGAPGGGGFTIDWSGLQGWWDEQLAKLPPGIAEAIRAELQEWAPAAWEAVKPDLPGVLARGFLLFLGYVAQWWMAGLDPHVAGEALRSSLLVQTPPEWTYANPEVQAMQAEVKTVALLLLGPAISLAALGVFLGRTDLETVLQGAIGSVAGVFAAEHVGRWLLDFGNALALVFLGGAQGLPGWEAMKAAGDAAVAPSADQAAINAGAVVLVFALAGALMLIADVLHALGTAVLYLFLPLCAACYALPFLQRFTRAALMALAIAAVVKAPGVAVLRVGSAVIGRAIGEGGQAGDAGALVFAFVGIWGVAGLYSLFLAKGALFAGTNLLAEGQRAGRTVVSVVREAPQAARYRLEQRQAQREAKALAAGGGTPGGATDGKPTMITHAHTHGHLIHREPAPASTTKAAAPSNGRASGASTTEQTERSA